MLKTTTDLRQSVSKSQNLGPKTYYARLSGVALPVVQAVEDNADVVDVELDSSLTLQSFFFGEFELTPAWSERVNPRPLELNC